MRLLAFVFFLVVQISVAHAQNPSPILQPGNAAVAGFSGAKPLDGPPPAQPFDKTFIDLDGPALRVIDLGRMGGPPEAQVVAAPKPFTVTAGQIGQVFSVTLDDARPPNIYAAATSAYGLPIVVPDNDGDGRPDRARRGAPNAAFMPGLFGPALADGGPGSIWRIDGVTGAVNLFANVTLAGVPNSGPALGGLAFDPASRQIFVADRDTGMIHRFGLDGADRGVFDHGTMALPAAGLPPARFDPRKRLNPESPAFDSTIPETWALAPAVRRVFGVAVRGGRLYYAVAAGLRVWSVAILPDGSFGGDARVEAQIAPGPRPGAEISDITFDDEGRMLLAERGAPTGAYDFQALAVPGSGRTLRLRPKPPGAGGTPFFWEVDGEYAVGFPPDFQNGNGGVALGYGYDPAGTMTAAVCGGTVWVTGEQLRISPDPAIARRLAAGGPFPIDGLQGHAVPLVRPQNAPPFNSYFIDYDDRTDRAGLIGHLGDVAIWRICGQATMPLPLTVAVACPAGLFNVDGVCQFGLACPAGTEFANGCCVYRDCPASYVRVRGRCVPPPMNCNSDETYANGRCEAPKCPAGLVLAGRNIAKNSDRPQRSTDCGPGEVFTNDHCQPAPGGGPKMCSGNYCKCPEGTQLSEDGTCKQSSGCGPNMTLRGGECTCENGYGYATDLKTCVPISVCDPGTPGGNTSGCCKPGRQWNQDSLSCDPTPRCDPSDPTSMVTRGGQCVCKDGSSGGQSGGSSPAAGLSGQNCCPTGRRYNPITNKCDPGDPSKPHLTIVKKAPESCTLVSNDGQVSLYRCTFTITISNDGTAPANNIPPVIDTPNAGTIVDVQSDGTWNCGVGNNTATCQRPSALGTGTSTWITVTLEQSSGNYTPNSGQIRDGAVTEAQNCAEIDTSGVVSAGQAINPGRLGDLGGQSLKSCDRIRIPRNPRNPPVTTCTPTRMPPCSGPSDNPTGRPLCHVGECDCPLTNGRALCGPSTCMTTCPAATPPPLPPPPPPPLTTSCQEPNFLVNGMCCDARSYQAGSCGGTTTTSCPAGMRRGFNGQCFFVDPGCQGPNCNQVTTGCADNARRNSDGNCPTPTTTTCPAKMMSADGTCCNIRDYNAGRCGGGQPGGCGSNQFRGDDGKCQNRQTSRCGAGQSWNGETCVKKGGNKQRNRERRQSDSDNKSSRTIHEKAINPSQLQRGLGQSGGSNQPINPQRRGR